MVEKYIGITNIQQAALYAYVRSYTFSQILSHIIGNGCLDHQHIMHGFLTEGHVYYSSGGLSRFPCGLSLASLVTLQWP